MSEELIIDIRGAVDDEIRRRANANARNCVHCRGASQASIPFCDYYGGFCSLMPCENFVQRKDADNTENDIISHPSHYTEGRKYEPKDVIRDWGLNFNLGNTVKYVARAGRKDDILQDLKKARQYLDFEIEYLEQERNHDI